jgi:hypothetical protein
MTMINVRNHSRNKKFGQAPVSGRVAVSGHRRLSSILEKNMDIMPGMTRIVSGKWTDGL